MPADFADWLDFVAVGALLAFTWQQGPTAFALLAAAMGLPYVLIGPLAGALTDRADLQRVLVLSNLGRAAATFAAAFAPDATVLLLIVFARGCADAFYTPAKQAAIQALVPAPDLMAANGISHAINQTSKVAGPALGGLLLLFLLPQEILLANAAVSLLAAAMLLGLGRRLRSATPSLASRSLLGDIREGLAEFSAKPALRAGLVLMAMGYFFLFLYDALIPLLTLALRYDESVFGLAVAAAGGGGVLASLAVGAWGARRNPFALMGLGYLISGPLAIVLGIAPGAAFDLPWVACIGVFAVLGAATAAVVVPFRTIIQREADAERIARVSATCEAVTVSVMLVAPFIGAAIAELYSVAAAFIAGGLALTLLAVAAFLAARRRGELNP
ncbi:MFS transporter [Pelagibius sp.]|uniref:MFS transporter n=1 Tax=Pelagibius sp. TaxID=1931238 RepID=UPI00260F3AF0|nr:MFS transporter [Pelagibius sp.]